MHINIIKKLSIFILVTTCFVVVFLILYQFENKHFLQNEITPWDGSIFKNLVLTLNDKSHEIVQFQFIEPHSSKLLFIVLVNFIKNYFELTIVNAMFWINIVCTYLLFLITFYFLGYFKKKIIIQLILTTCFFLMWNTQLRFSIYMPSFAFAFNTLLITLSTMSIFFLIEKKFYHFLAVIPFVILIAFQRYMVISSIILSSLIFFYLINNVINTGAATTEGEYLVNVDQISALTYVTATGVLTVELKNTATSQIAFALSTSNAGAATPVITAGTPTIQTVNRALTANPGGVKARYAPAPDQNTNLAVNSGLPQRVYVNAIA